MALSEPTVDDSLIGRTVEALAGRWPAVRVASFDALTGGASSLTYAASLVDGPADRVVVKVAPSGLPPVRNRDVLRQADVLARLAGHPDVRVPLVYGRSVGDPPEVPPLFVMSFEPGGSDEPLQVRVDLEPGLVRSRALHAARMLAALHLVDVDAVDEPRVTPGQELNKWGRAILTVPAGHQVGTEHISTLLRDRLPGSGSAVLSHGDWRLGNALCVAGEIRSVIDWEIWSIGDARVDLAWFLMMCDPAHPAAVAGPETGMPPVADLLTEYERGHGRPVEDLGWFRALAAYKQAATTALIAKHSAKRGVPMEPTSARMSGLLPELLTWAESFLPGPTTPHSPRSTP